MNITYHPMNTLQEVLDRQPCNFAVYDTETCSDRQIALYRKLAPYFPPPYTPDTAYEFLKKQKRVITKTLANGTVKNVNESYFNIGAEACLKELGLQRPLKTDIAKLWKPFLGDKLKRISSDMLDPLVGKVGCIQVALFTLIEGALDIKVFGLASDDLQELKPYYTLINTHPNVPYLVGQNLQFDFRFSYASFGELPAKPSYDTKTIQCLYNANSDSEERVGLNDLCKTYGLPEEYAKVSLDPTAYDWTNPPEEAMHYALQDVIATGLVFLEQVKNPEFYEISALLEQESSLQRALTYASIQGIGTDLTVVQRLLSAKLNLVEQYTATLIEQSLAMGWELPEKTSKYLNSNDYSAQIKQGLEAYAQHQAQDPSIRFPFLGRKKAKGSQSIYQNTAWDVVKEAWTPFLETYWALKSTLKDVSSYRTLLRTAKQSAFPGYHTVHSVFSTTPAPAADKNEKQGGTVSGRFSTTNFSMLNRSEADKQAHKARPGYVILTYDYSNIESRVAGSLLQEPNLVSIFNEGRDQYREFASKVYNIPVESIAKKSTERALSKEAVLAFIFFGPAYTFMTQLLISSKGEIKMPIEEADRFHNIFWEAFPTMKRNAHDRWVKACVQGYYCSVLGRKRKFNYEVLQAEMRTKKRYGRELYMPRHIEDSNANIYLEPDVLQRASSQKFKGLRSNHEVQTTAGEGIKGAVARIPFVENGWYFLGVIHDSLEIEVPVSDVEKAHNIVPQAMLQSMRDVLNLGNGLPVTLEVEGTQGICWAKYNPSKVYIVEDTPGYYQTPNYKWRLKYNECTVERLPA